MLRVLLINTNETAGGAAIAAHRLMSALNKTEVKAKMLVVNKVSDNVNVVPLKHKYWQRFCFLWERFTIWLVNGMTKKNLFTVDFANVGNDITSLPEFKEADIIHLHWINQGFLSLSSLSKILSSGKPVVWTLHDMWAVTAVCHHARQCNLFTSGCHHCPQLVNALPMDMAKKIYHQKKVVYAKSTIHFVGCSKWIAKQAALSALTKTHRVDAIANALNTSVYKPMERNHARTLLNLPLDKKLILFGAVKTTDPRKGIDYMVSACERLSALLTSPSSSWAVVVVGNGGEVFRSLLPCEVYPLGFVSDEERMVLVYNAVDMFVTPSLEENLPNTIAEALCCGTPCVGFRIGGIPEMIDHQKNGYVAQYRSADDLAEGMAWVINHPSADDLREDARKKGVASFNENTIAHRYIDLYTEAVARNRYVR